MNEGEKLVLIAISFILFSLIIGIAMNMLGLESMGTASYEFNATIDCCCEGGYCTDTYYDFDRGRCQSTFRMFFLDNSYNATCTREWSAP